MDKAHYLEKFKNYSDETLEGMLKTGNYNAAATAAMVEILGGTNTGVDYQALATESQQKAIESSGAIPKTSLLLVAIVSLVLTKVGFFIFDQLVIGALADAMGAEKASQIGKWILTGFVWVVIIGTVLAFRKIIRDAKADA